MRTKDKIAEDIIGEMSWRLHGEVHQKNVRQAMDVWAKECFIEIGQWVKDNEFIEADGMWYEQPMYTHETLGLCLGDYSDLFNKYQQETSSLK